MKAIELPQADSGSCSRASAGSAWVDADKWLPMGPHEVLATDSENIFMAYWKESIWWLHELEEPCDSEVTHWMELPDLPEL